ncbi:Phage tail assembly chaperone protein, TAC6 [Rhabdaerophilaceae bacterium]
MHAFPWDEAMALGFGLLRLSPQAFWSMTLPELAAAARGATGFPAAVSPPDFDAITHLMQLFPDKTGECDG